MSACPSSTDIEKGQVLKYLHKEKRRETLNIQEIKVGPDAKENFMKEVRQSGFWRVECIPIQRMCCSFQMLLQRAEQLSHIWIAEGVKL